VRTASLPRSRDRPTSLVAAFRSLSPAGRMLVVNQFGVNAGFFMVVPFLATHLSDEIGLTAVVVGLIMGLRVFSQQGLFLVGGFLADRLGPRPVIIAGCALRVVAFGVFAVATSAPWVVLATVLTGVAGAVFNPAVRTYLISESPGRHAEAFSVFTAVSNAGSLIGPLIGAALLAVDFRLVSLVACGVFAALTIAQLFVLPRRSRPPAVGTVGSDAREVLGNGRFWLFSVVGSAYLALFNQLYLVFPLEATRVTGTAWAVSVALVVSTVVGIGVAMPVLSWCRSRYTPGRSMAVGLAVMASGFGPMAAAAPWQATATSALPVGPALAALSPVLLGISLLSVGVAIANPFSMEVLPAVGSARLLGTYFGGFSLISALTATGLSAGIGALQGLPGSGARALPFLAAVVLGVAGALGTGLMQRAGALDARPEEAAPRAVAAPRASAR
jgi:hypothetical protein